MTRLVSVDDEASFKNEAKESQMLHALNEVGAQVRQSPFKMLTALVNLTMVLDEIEATRMGISPW